jgi:hypothetical protein
MREITQLIADAEVAGVSISLTVDEKIRLDGPRPKVKKTAALLHPHRTAVIEYLKMRDPATMPIPPTDDDDATELIGEHQSFSHCPHCHCPLVAPAPAIQMANFAKWQHERISYYWWTDPQLNRLAERLAPGEVLMLPSYAHSVNIRRPDGSVVVHNRVK